MDLRQRQEPLKQRYREQPETAVITLRAEASTETPLSCNVDLGRAIYAAQAHAGVGGEGSGACSGDLLLAALAACAQITCQMVAQASGVPLDSVAVSVEGDLDLRGTLGISRETPVGFAAIRLHFDLQAPNATPEQLARLQRSTERYCVVAQTLLQPPALEVQWRSE